MKMEWRKTGNRLEAIAGGFLRFAVVRERHGWMLYRYSTTLAGETKFKSKESVRTKTHGRHYAENLWRLSGRNNPETSK